MHVAILCGGLGTRLREETEFRPKPMVNIGSRPIVWHIMKIYSHYGHKDFVLALGYKGEVIKEYFYHYEVLNNDVTLQLGKPESVQIHQSHDENGWRVTLSDTGEKTLKGGRLKRIQKYISCDTFMMTYGDGVADININDLLEFHQSHGKVATVTGINPNSRFGELKLNGNRVASFNEKPKNENGLVNGGFFVFNKKIFDYVAENEDCDLEIGALEKVASDGQLMVYKHDGFWACMDTLRDVDYLNGIWKENQAKWKVW